MIGNNVKGTSLLEQITSGYQGIKRIARGIITLAAAGYMIGCIPEKEPQVITPYTASVVAHMDEGTEIDSVKVYTLNDERSRIEIIFGGEDPSPQTIVKVLKEAQYSDLRRSGNLGVFLDETKDGAERTLHIYTYRNKEDALLLEIQ